MQATPQTVASGQTPITIDWDYLNLAYVQGVPGREDQDGRIPSDGVYGALLLPGDQRDGAAPVGGAALAGVPLLRPGPAALAEGLLASGAASTDLVERKVVPKALINALPIASARTPR